GREPGQTRPPNPLSQPLFGRRLDGHRPSRDPGGGGPLGARGGARGDRIINVSPAPDLDSLARDVAFGSAEESVWARAVIRTAAREAGLGPASIRDLYAARGRGEISGFTVPAFNIRTLTYQQARRIFRAAKRLNAGALV